MSWPLVVRCFYRCWFQVDTVLISFCSDVMCTRFVSACLDPGEVMLSVFAHIFVYTCCRTSNLAVVTKDMAPLPLSSATSVATAMAPLPLAI